MQTKTQGFQMRGSKVHTARSFIPGFRTRKLSLPDPEPNPLATVVPAVE
jgi:hypothetical protein